MERADLELEGRGVVGGGDEHGVVLVVAKAEVVLAEWVASLGGHWKVLYLS